MRERKKRHGLQFRRERLIDIAQRLVDRRFGLLRSYCWASALLLSATAFLKLLAALTRENVMMQPDPVFEPIPICVTALGAALLEIAVMLQLLRRKPFARFVVGLAWMSALFVIYRATMFWSGTGMPCRCLGHFGNVAGMSELVVDRLALLLLLWFGIPSWLIMACAVYEMIRIERLTGQHIPWAMVRVVRRLTPVFLISTLGLAELSLAAETRQSFSLDGLVRRQILGPDGELQREPRGQFHLRVDDAGRYSLSLMTTGSLGMARLELGSDGSNVFEVIRTSVGLSQGKFMTNANWDDSPRAVANVYPVRHPVSSGDLAGVIWAIFLGTHEGTPQFRRLPAFWQPVGVDPRAHCFEVVDRGGFAEGREGAVLEYIFRQHLWTTAESHLFYALKSEEDVRFRRMVERVVKSMPDGFMELSIEILESRAVGEQLVPFHVIATMFYGDWTSLLSPENAARVASIYDISVSAARVDADEVSLPANPGTLAVYDFRRSFNDGRQAVDRVAYSLVGDALHSVSQGDLDKLLKEQLDLAVPVASYQSLAMGRLVRYVGALTLVLLLILPAVHWLKYRKAAQNV